MISITISKADLPIITAINPNLKLSEEPEAGSDQLCFNCSAFSFKELYAAVKNAGHNPFALMQWQTVKRKSANSYMPYVQAKDLIK